MLKKGILFISFISIFSLLDVHRVSAQETATEETDSLSWVDRSWIVLPSFFYTPRTKFAGGGSVQFIPRHPAGQRPSSIAASFIYTQNKQIVLSVVPDFFFNQGRQRVYLSASYLRYPDVFFGLGNSSLRSESEAYSSRIANFFLSAENEFFPSLHLGLQANFRYEDLYEFEEGGILATGIPGTGESSFAGAGPFIRWDTRDNIFYALKGYYARLSWMRYGKALGGDYTFSRTTLDTRVYFPLNWRQSMAFQVYFQGLSGDAFPFQYKPELGGRDVLRGYNQGRFRDDVLLALQMEYRLWVMGPLSFTAFASVGDVESRVEDLFSRKAIFAAGPGVRILTNPNGLNFRVDYGIGTEGGRLYLTVGEAF